MAAEDLQPREVHKEEDITEEHSFDELARGLASGISRRQALKVLGGSLAGGLLAVFGVGGVAAADEECKPNGKKCRKNAQCCSGSCANGTCAACPSGTVELSNGTCATPCTGVACPDGCGGCTPAVGGGDFCRDISGPQGECATHTDCPEGQFCTPGGAPVNECTGAC